MLYTQYNSFQKKMDHILIYYTEPHRTTPHRTTPHRTTPDRSLVLRYHVLKTAYIQT